MKTIFTRVHVFILFITFCLPCVLRAQYGRVLINEYLPWPNNACGTTAEFVELLNMGPGPVNIGCYVVTDGDFTVTIPANTILMPGQFYVIAGQATIFPPCANFAKTVTVDLNWNTCGCTNATIPFVAPGWMTDGGFANEQVVLMGPSGQLVDAIVRNFPVEPSALLTTRNIAGCTQQTFDLDNLPVPYETVGESTGRGNSIARKLDGDCGWVKDTQQTGGETNNTPGARSAFTLTMFITEDLFCAGGSARFVVDQNPAGDWFPVDYILGYDSDGDGQFTMADTYTTGIDFTAPDLVISGLPLGLYAINIGPQQGCSYQNFTFAIGPCVTLGFSIRDFNAQKLNDIRIWTTIAGASEAQQVLLEGSTNGREFFIIDTLPFEPIEGSQNLSYAVPANTTYTHFRLMMVNRDNKAIYSPIRKINAAPSINKVVLGNNPVSNEIRLVVSSAERQILELQVLNSAGQLMQSQRISLATGQNQVILPAGNLTRGVYFVRASMGVENVECFRIIKQ